MALPLNRALIDLLACPKCKGPLRLSADERRFECEQCRLVFAIEDGIPNFLLEEAKPLE